MSKRTYDKMFFKDCKYSMTKTSKNETVFRIKNDVIFYIMLESSYKKDVQLKAIEKISNENILMRIVLTNRAYDLKGFYLKWKAIKKISHEKTFYKIAKHIDTSDDLTDQERHTDIKTMSKHQDGKITPDNHEDIKSICEYALEHVKDVEYLKDISENAKSNDVRKKAHDILSGLK